ncbi:D-aminoacyl-tRNA deacylase [Aegicerativicinus sediminis]|uniref:D-aminoacyl-tRNA deacylase n=1 Tax=Aegicerativicinus sediminis TaxID=2893202 RepID=UPI001E62EDD7|nr:D-aminoacyl-tRNA deacylase [Aegicerativicinus sediminis]
MKVVIQRVTEAKITIDSIETKEIGPGLVVLLGIVDDDGKEDIEWLINKIVNLRIFNDGDGIMNRSVTDIGGEILLVSQFTLHASTKKGHRPSYIKAAKPDIAVPLYNQFLDELKASFSGNIETGKFGADMQVFLINDGPVTIIIDSKDKI